MDYPQYLWRIGNRNGWQLCRRGHEVNEPMDKHLVWLDSRQVTYSVQAHLAHYVGGALPFGVLPYCDLGDKEFYSRNHPWDWLNE